MTLRGVYEGDSPAAVLAFEQWLGAQVDTVVTFFGQASWADFEGSAAWFSRDVWSQIDRQMIWSVPLTVEGATLDAAASGAYNDHYRVAAQWIDSYAPGETIYIRTGWEFNGDWMPWSAIGTEQAYIDAFHQLVDTFRSVSDRFVFDWNVNVGNHGMNPADAYPGDAYVDIISMDFYHDPAWDPADPVLAWEQMVHRTYGLDWLENFAAMHGKPTAYTEWGVKTNNMEPYIELAKAWFDSHNVVYHNLWDANAGGYTGRLSDGTNPDTGNAYRTNFAESGSTNDEQWAPAGNDTMHGDGGADRMFGNEGNDLLSGGDDDDLMDGGTGDDQVIGDHGNDTLHGGDGWDFVNGGWGDDYIDGGGTNDELWGLPGNDTMYGGDGPDRMFGNEDNDFLSGGDEDDLMNGGTGADVIQGGAGQDTAMFDGNAADFLIEAGVFGDWTVTDIATGETDVVTDVEFLAFFDTTMQIVHHA